MYLIFNYESKTIETNEFEFIMVLGYSPIYSLQIKACRYEKYEKTLCLCLGLYRC